MESAQPVDASKESTPKPLRSKIPRPSPGKILQAGDTATVPSTEDTSTQSTQSCNSTPSGVLSPSVAAIKIELDGNTKANSPRVKYNRETSLLRLKKLEMEELQQAHAELLDKHALALKDIESYQTVLKDVKADHKEQVEKLGKDIEDLKNQLSLDGCAYNLLNVLRENGDTIVVAERESRLLTNGLKDMSDRAETIFFHLSAIAKDFCQKLDDFQRGCEKRGLNLTPLPPSPYIQSSVTTLKEEKEYLKEKLAETERLLEQAQAEKEEMKDTVEEITERIHHSLVESSFVGSHAESLYNAIENMNKENARRSITLALRQGVLSPEEAYRQLTEADALMGLSLEDLKAMAKKKKGGFKKTIKRAFTFNKHQHEKPPLPQIQNEDQPNEDHTDK